MLVVQLLKKKNSISDKNDVSLEKNQKLASKSTNVWSFRNFKSLIHHRSDKSEIQ